MQTAQQLDIKDISAKEAASVLLERRMMRASLSPFVKKVFSTVDPGTLYKHNWHIDLICEYLEACTRREIKRLIINIPPRHLKSIIASVAWPAWVLGNNPSEQFLCTSYSGSLSIQHSVDCRLVMQSLWYRQTFPEIELTGDMNMKSEFKTTKRGHRIATSVGATSIGKGGNFLLIDDPVNPEQALSDTERTKANTYIDQSFMTRINNEDTGVVAMIMQRLNVDDSSGHLIEKGGWEHVVVPMEAEIKTIIDFGKVQITREIGDLLDSKRMGKEAVAQKKIDLGSYAFAGQYQQRPAPLEGGMIELGWFKRYKTAPTEGKRRIHSWDTAQKEKELNDFTACIDFLETEKGYYILEVFKEKLRYPRLKKKVTGFYDRDNPDAILVEDKSSGSSLIQDLEDDEDTKYPVIAIEPCGDKVTRLDTCSPTVEAGNVYLPEKAPWLVDFESDISNFPNIPKKDTIDAFSQFLNWAKKPEKAPRARMI